MGKKNELIEAEDECYHRETFVTCFKSNGKNRHSMSCCTKKQHDEIKERRRERAKKKMEKLKKKTSLELVSKIDDYEPIEHYGKDQCHHTGKPRVPKEKKKKEKVKWKRKRKYPKNEDMHEGETFEKQTEFDAKLEKVKIDSQEMKEMYDEELFFSDFSDSDEIIHEYEMSFDEIYESNMRKLAKLYAKEGEMLKSQKILKTMNDYILNDYMNCLKSNAEWFFKKTILRPKKTSVVSSTEMHLLDTWNAYYRLTYSKIFYEKKKYQRCIDYTKPLISYDVELMVCREVDSILNM